MSSDGRRPTGTGVSGAQATGAAQNVRSSSNSNSNSNSNGSSSSSSNSGRQCGYAITDGSSITDSDGDGVDAILPVVAAAKAAAEAAATASLSTVLQRPSVTATGVVHAPLAAAVAAALQVESQVGCQAAAAATAANLDSCAASLAPSPASQPPPCPHQPHSTAYGPVDGSSSASSNGSTSSSTSCHGPHPPPALERPTRWPLATANRRYLILARSLIHAWGADPQSALDNAVWAGCGPLVSELLRAGADPRALRHGHASFGNAVTWGRWDIVEGMYGRGDVRTALFLVAMKGLLLLYSAAVHLDFRLRLLVGQGVWGLAALGRMRVVRWAAAAAERAWVALWHALWWWMWG